ncbi:hypothetical protein [Streptomyces chartreusis]
MQPIGSGHYVTDPRRIDGEWKIVAQHRILLDMPHVVPDVIPGG